MNRPRNITDPLPSHPPLDIWEVYARLVLNYIDSATYSNLTHSDKPDLVDRSNDLGVEVTEAIQPNSREVDSLHEKLLHEKNEQKRERLKERIERIGGKVLKLGYCGPKGVDNFDLIMGAFQKKLNKLNSGHYQCFTHNHLFIRSDILATPAMLNDALEQLIKLNCKETTFGRVIVSVPNYNYDFDLTTATESAHPFNYSDQFRIVSQAREIVEKAIARETQRN